MTSQSPLVERFCRIYSALLYAYPREFRMEYGVEMRQLFRDRCRDVARAPGMVRWLRFAVQSGADWMLTALREHAAGIALRNGARKAAGEAGRHVAAIWSAGRRHAPRGFVAEWLFTILVYLFATTTLVQAYVVPTGSMESNLRVGDHMLVDRLAYAKHGALGSHLLPYRVVQRGDIVAFLFPEDVRQTYVKRVIGLPGDRIHLENKQVIRNGRRLIEPYTQYISPMREPYRDDFPGPPDFSTTPRGREMLDRHVSGGEVVVPPDTLFVLGDNRDNSLDSRYWGFVPREYVVGKPLVVYWSYDAPTSELQDWHWSHVVDVALHFFTKTRWDRTLLVPRSQSAQETGGGL